MAQVALDGFYIVPIFDGDNSVLMPQIMKAQLRAAHVFDDPSEAIVDCSIGQKTALLVIDPPVFDMTRRSARAERETGTCQ